MIIGADYYENEAQRQALMASGQVPIGIGENSIVDHCIADKNARIGKNVKIVNKDGVQVGKLKGEGCVGRGPGGRGGD